MKWQAKAGDPPPGYQYGPSYRLSWQNFLRGVLYIALARPRSLGHDALLVTADMPAAPRAHGVDHIPANTPFVILANHYERPGLWMAWPVMHLANLIRIRTGQDAHWMVIAEWESLSIFGIPIPRRIIHAVFQRSFGAYGILSMAPPYAPTSARAASMRAATQVLKSGHSIGLMPEGDVGPTPELLEAREGVGAFLLLLANTGAHMLPVGLYEESGHLVANIGASFALSVPPDVQKADRDRWVRGHVMEAIRDLLPEPLWGAYSDNS